MKQIAAAFFILFLFVAGCPQEDLSQQHSIDSLAIESKDHIFSNEYTIFVKIDEDAYGTPNNMVLYKNANKLIEYPLEDAEVPQGGQLVFLWPATATGEYTIRAAIEDANGTQLSNSKALEVAVNPLGFYNLESRDSSRPVETGVWCAQQFKLEHEVPISIVELHLRSMVPTRAGKTVTAEIVNDEGHLPGETVLASASIASTSVPSAAEWITFTFGGTKIPAGTYWLLLKRDDTVGNIAWTYEQTGSGSAFCRDLAETGNWEFLEGDLAFKIK